MKLEDQVQKMKLEEYQTRTDPNKHMNSNLTAEASSQTRCAHPTVGKPLSTPEKVKVTQWFIRALLSQSNSITTALNEKKVLIEIKKHNLEVCNS